MDEKKKVVPYFARLLENVKQEDLKNIQGGAVTMKYPSDNDEEFIM